jgi:hypothetical protein
MHWSVGIDDPEAFEAFVAENSDDADIWAPDAKGYSALHWAAAGGNLVMVIFLVCNSEGLWPGHNWPINRTGKTKSGKTAAMIAREACDRAREHQARAGKSGEGDWGESYDQCYKFITYMTPT